MLADKTLLYVRVQMEAYVEVEFCFPLRLTFSVEFVLCGEVLHCTSGWSWFKGQYAYRWFSLREVTQKTPVNRLHKCPLCMKYEFSYVLKVAREILKVKN